MGRVHRNIMSLAMVEAAILSASSGARISVDELLEDSYQQALRAELNPDVRGVLQSWPSVRNVLTGQSVRL